MNKSIKFLGIVALIIATVVMFSSCNKYERKIVGKWKIIKEKHDGSPYDSDEGETITFKDNGTCTIVFWGDECDGDYSLNGESLTIDAKYPDGKYTFTFDVEIKKSVMYLSGKCKDTYDDYYYDYYKGTDNYKVSYELEKMK